MRKALPGIAAAIVILWVAMWVGSLLVRSAVRTGPENEWPLGLGTLGDVPQRYPAQGMSPAAARLIALSAPLGIEMAPRDRQGGLANRRTPMEFVRGQLTEWVSEQLSSPSETIASLPAESGEYLAGRAADLTAVQQLLLSGEPVRWATDITNPFASLPNLLGHLQLNRVLVGRGLDRARFGDPGGWDDLRAAWNLARPLTERPEMISNLIALAMARNVNAAARKMSLPAPAWLHEIQQFDFRRALLAAAQVEAWQMNDRVYIETTVDTPVVRRGVDAVMAPYTRLAAANWAEASREIASRVASTKRCDLAPELMSDARRGEIAWWNLPAREAATPNADAIWARALRFTAEREGTVRAIALRAAAAPQPQSACAGERWIYAENGRSFRFSDPMAPPSPDLFTVPLEFALDAGH